MNRLLLIIPLFAGLLYACAEEVELPAAASLAVDSAIIQGLPGAEPGPYEVAIARDITLPARGGARELVLNIYYPTAGKNHPLLLFSHGNWSNKDSYDRLLEHWVSHGYVVLAPNHLDCCSPVKGIFNSLRYGQLGLIEERVSDLQRLLVDLERLEQLHVDFRGRADSLRLALTGHSFGAFTAQQFGGAAALDPDTGTYRSHYDPGVAAIVALSPPGPMFDTITAQSWRELATPTLVTTGTWDIQPRFWPDWRLHLMSWETARPGDKYALVTEGADHYLGNLICRPEREATPQKNALTMVKIATTAFLEAFLKNDTSAREFLAGDALADHTGDFSRLSRR